LALLSKETFTKTPFSVKQASVVGAVMKKTALAIMIVSALLLSSAELVKLAECNPYWIYDHFDPVPGTIPPSIFIFNPQNYTSYLANSMTVNILVKDAELAGWHCNIEWVGYSIDGRTVELYTLWQRHEQGEEVHPIYIPSDINFTLSSLALGKHILTVSAAVAVLGSQGARPAVFFIDCNSTVFFSVGTADYSPAPTPAATPESTSTPEPTAAPEATSQPATFPATLIFFASVGITIVAIGLVVYFKKHKR